MKQTSTIKKNQISYSFLILGWKNSFTHSAWTILWNVYLSSVIGDNHWGDRRVSCAIETEKGGKFYYIIISKKMNGIGWYHQVISWPFVRYCLFMVGNFMLPCSSIPHLVNFKFGKKILKWKEYKEQRHTVVYDVTSSPAIAVSWLGQASSMLSMCRLRSTILPYNVTQFSNLIIE